MPRSAPALTLFAEAAAVLRKGGLVVVPTETVLGLCASGTSKAAVESLRAARDVMRPGPAGKGPCALHLASVDPLRVALDKLGPVAPLHAHALTKLLPGPVTLRIERAPVEIARIVESLGGVPGAFDDGGAILVRVPRHPAATSMLEAATVPVVAVGIVHNGDYAASVAEAKAALDAAGIMPGAILDGAPAPAGKPSTTVTLTAAGGWLVSSPGLLAEIQVSDLMQRRVLFVCTGNTCRSPMAQAIARGLAERTILKIPTTFESAGTSAFDGGSFTSETRAAVEKLGLSPPRGTSHTLTAELIGRADVIYAMTRSHKRAVESILPGAASKTRLLDPAGKDVADPVGGPQSLYDEVARGMKGMVEQRLNALEDPA